MNCRRVEQLLFDHLEGLLPARETGAVAAHLDGCASCRRRRDAFLALRAELRGLAELQPPPHLARRAVHRWSSERDTQPHAADSRSARNTPAGTIAWRLMASSACAAALVFLAVLSLALAWRSHSSPSRHRTDIAKRTDFLPRNREKSESTNGQPDFNPTLPSETATQVATSPSVEPKDGAKDPSKFLPIFAPSPSSRFRGKKSEPISRRANRGDDLKYLNGDDPVRNQRPWAPVTRDEWDMIEEKVRRNVHVKDDFVQIAFPRIAGAAEGAIVAAVEQYKREAAVIDPRLFHEVTLDQKATALSDLCDHLRSDTGIQLTAGSSVADEKVTLFCTRLPLREVMRQLSRPFGYTWLRSGKPGEYRYELVQDLRSQLEEDALRNRDRNEALVALDREMGQYRPYLSLSPDEALARARTAPPAEKRSLERFAGSGWGPVQLYFRLSPADLAALRAGQRLMFSANPGADEQSLPRDLGRGVLQSLRDARTQRRGSDLQVRAAKSAPEGVAPSALPEEGARITLEMDQSDLGQIKLVGGAGILISAPGDGHRHWMDVGELAVGVSPAVRSPQNRAANLKLAHDPALGSRVTIRPQSSCTPDLSPSPSPARGGVPVARGNDTRNAEPSVSPLGLPAPSRGGVGSEPKVTTADVLEALHRATGKPVVADFYTRLYPLASVTVRSRSLFDALNQLADAMHLRWTKDKESGWLEFRSASFYDDRLQEVPHRLLARWEASRHQRGALSLDDLLEIAQLSDPQLDASGMAEGARICCGLAEWDLARRRALRPHLRYLAQLSPAQRQAAQSAKGLPFTQLTLPQQQQFIALALGRGTDRLQSLEGLAGATLRVDYSLPGGFQWRRPGEPSRSPWQMLEPPPVRERTREAALLAARRINAQASDAQIAPTDLALSIIYAPAPDAHLAPGGVVATLTRTANLVMAPISP
jgi:putative zinc finger protein